MENEIMNFENMPSAKRKQLFHALTAMELQETQEGLAQLAVEVERQNKKISEIEEATKQIADKSSFVNKRVYGDDFVNVSLLGQDCDPIISNQRMNKLLVIVGINMKVAPSKPRQELYKGKDPIVQRRKVTFSNNGEDFQPLYHRERIWIVIKNRLDKMGFLNTFMSCKTKDEMDKFIDGLYNGVSIYREAI